MDFFSLLWIFFIISSLQSVIRQKMLEVARLQKLQQLEEPQQIVNGYVRPTETPGTGMRFDRQALARYRS